MITTCLSVALATILNLTATCTAGAPYSPALLMSTLPINDRVGYAVRRDESIKDIARLSYGNEDYWTTLWNDNPEIEDPESIEEGAFIRMRITPPKASESLKTELAQRVNGSSTTVYSAVLPNLVVESVQVTEAVKPVIQAAPIIPKSLTEAQINFLGACEAGMDPAKNTGNGYYGAFQFSYGTWKSMNTGYERADLAPLEVQKEAVQRLVHRSNIFSQFPACSNRMRSQGLI